ncbi:hypothetical protein MIV111R [Invertebrate iridescent virus 3]|uniref:Putative hydrolase 111R n=1 Tax=Invertebrate iridescent virus 3 TaxID=345201 RepID=VF414_IIV3|nr:nudix hydrolase [Invertebrate iridescent virus 3]Q196U9.1 RecName: Full=Putative hydrolase 111R [Invertebrate iridescent virus 3]ABF82141.1 hypothetical protein MIV111R [Invertebrate iridescent virus 3]
MYFSTQIVNNKEKIMDTIFCNKGCCSLQTIKKKKPKVCDPNERYPFEKRKAGVFVECGSKFLLVQSYNDCWGIPKGHMEAYDHSPKTCAERELKEETGLEVKLTDAHLFRILLDNYYIYKISIPSVDQVDLSALPQLDSTGIGWVDMECAFDLNLTVLTQKILMALSCN